jgi:hypothetical protein
VTDLPLQNPVDLNRMRAYRLSRIRAELKRRDISFQAMRTRAMDAGKAAPKVNAVFTTPVGNGIDARQIVLARLAGSQSAAILA